MSPIFFLSYSTSDTARVEAVADELRRLGLDIWLDRDQIGAGASIVEKIETGLRQFKFFVAFVSTSYLDKTWTMLEYRAALYAALGARERSVVVVRLDDAELPPLIADRRYLKFHSAAQVAEELARIVDQNVAIDSARDLSRQSLQAVSWESLQYEVVDTVLNELLTELPQLRLRSPGAFIPFKVVVSRKMTIVLSLARVILNNRQLEAQVRIDRETLYDVRRAAEINRALLRQNGLGIFTGGFEVDLERKQREIDDRWSRIRDWLSAISPEIWISDPSTETASPPSHK